MEITPTLTPGYRLNAQIIHRDLYRLAVALVSFERLGKGSEQLHKLRERCAEDEISHLLVTTALANRLQLDHMQQLRDDPSELSFEVIKGPCGFWGWGEEFKTPKSLEFREACNKIIHAANIAVASVATPSLHLEGKKGKDDWQVTVDLLLYIDLSFDNFENGLS